MVSTELLRKLYILLLLLFSCQGQSNILSNCLDGWNTFFAQEICYKYILAPKLDFDRANKACYDLTDGYGGLVSINNNLENGEITQELSKLQNKRAEWYTSGKLLNVLSNGTRLFRWVGDGELWEDDNKFWLDERNRFGLADPDATASRSVIIYKSDYAAIEKWAWSFVSPDVPRSYVCELSMSNVRAVKLRRDHEYGRISVDERYRQRGPTFTQQPLMSYFVKNSLFNFVSLECIAEGFPYPEYRWLRNTGTDSFTPIQSVDTRFLLINGKLILFDPDKATDFGQYYCEASNSFGTVRSNTADLLFAELSLFSNTPRQPLSAPLKKYKVIECSPPSHSPSNPIIQWYKENPYNFINTELKRHIFPSATGQLYFQAVEENDAGTYFCSVRLNIPQASTYAISAPIAFRTVDASSSIVVPRILSGFPKFITISNRVVSADVPLRGYDVRFECMAEGTGALEFWWTRKDKREITDRAVYEAGNWNRAFTIRGVQLEDAGDYICNVKNSKQDQHQLSVNFIVKSEPFFVIPLLARHVDIGLTDFTWHCEASGDPAVEYLWLKDGKLFNLDVGEVCYPTGCRKLSEEGRISFSVLGNVIKFSTIVAQDAGMYQCGAVNTYGTRYSTAELRTLKFKPSFDKHPLIPNLLTTVSANVTLPCRPEGAPEPTIKWLKNGIAIPGLSNDVGASNRLLPDGSLYFKAAGAEMEGLYTCEASNTEGIISSSTVLTVLEATKIETAPQSQVVDVNATVHFSCLAWTSLRLDLTYLWQHNNRFILFANETNRFQRSTRLGSTGELVILRASFEDEGSYKCIAQTPSGRVERMAELRVRGPPAAPAGVHVANKETATIDDLRITWFDGDDHLASIEGYVVQALQAHSNVWTEHSKLPISTVPRVEGRPVATLRDLNSYVEYRFRVAAWNSFGTGVFSRPTNQRFQTPMRQPIRIPRNVTGGGGKEGMLQVFWDPMSKDEFNGPNFRYQVSFRPGDTPSKSDLDWQTEDALSTACDRYDKRCRFVTVLNGKDKYYRLYDVRVRAVNMVGSGPWTEFAQVYSAELMPQYRIMNVYAVPENSTAIRIFWGQVPNTRKSMNGALLGFRINYWLKDNETELMEKRQTIWGATQTNGTIIGLEPYTEYMMNVMVWTSAGNGPKSSFFIQSTLRKRPQQIPTEVHLYPHGADSINVKFRGVLTDHNEEPLQGYKVRYWRRGEDMLQAAEFDCRKEVSVVITGLESKRTYNLRVFGYSRGGEGKMSSPVITFSIVPGCIRIAEDPDVVIRQICDERQAYFAWQAADVPRFSMVLYPLSFLVAVFLLGVIR